MIPIRAAPCRCSPVSDEPDAFKDFLSLANAHSDSDIARNTVVFSLTQAF